MHTTNRKSLTMKTFRLIIILAAFITMSAEAAAKAAFSIYETSCNGGHAPAGIDETSLSFSWKITSELRGFKQTAYRILVADSREKLNSGKGCIWDSGRCRSEKSVMVKYEGAPLKSSTKYYWKVKVWNEKHKASEWSEAATFITGMYNQADWNGSCWIALENDDSDKSLLPGIHSPEVESKIGRRMVGNYRIPVFRKSITVNKKVREAIAHISGLGHFDFFINGQKVGTNFLDAGWTQYSKTILYATFDITTMLDQGENVLSAMLGNGFYNVPRERYFKQLISYGAPKLRTFICITYNDGTSDTIVTDKSWKTCPGPITYSSIYGGEDFDARILPETWKLKGFDDSNWSTPVTSANKAQMRHQQSPPLMVRNQLPTVRKYRNSRGSWIFDFGQNFSGIVGIKIRGKSGQHIILKPGELLNSDSTVNQNASGGPYYWKYTLSGKGVESWHPQFTYYGFRYVEASGDADLSNLEVTGMHTTSSAEEYGHFSCSMPMFNKTYDLIDWAIRSNMASILTDCPHREKLGWLEVAHLMMYSMNYRYGLDGLYRKIMNDMKDSQTERGTIPSIAPEYVRFAGGFEDSPEWGSAFIILPWYVYRWYGDTGLIETYYQDMKRYLDYLTSRAEGGIIQYGLGDWYDLGPNNPGYAQLTSNGVTATAMYYYDTTLMCKMAQLLDRKDDVKTFTKQAEEIKKAYNMKFYNSQKQYYDRNSQTANAISLYFGLVDNSERNAVYKNLLDDIRKRNYALTSGDIGYRYLLQVLEDNGDAEIIYKMNTKYDVPGYGWQLAYGATALTESWQAYGFVSNNHCMLGHLMEWFFGGLGGIRQDNKSCGYKNIVISPQIVDGVDNASTSYESPYGEITCNWKKKGNSIEVETMIPANAQADIILPASDMNLVSESGLPLKDADICKAEVEGDGRHVKVEVLSGHYRFVCKGSR